MNLKNKLKSILEKGSRLGLTPNLAYANQTMIPSKTYKKTTKHNNYMEGYIQQSDEAFYDLHINGIK